MMFQLRLVGVWTMKTWILPPNASMVRYDSSTDDVRNQGKGEDTYVRRELCMYDRTGNHSTSFNG